MALFNGGMAHTHSHRPKPHRARFYPVERVTQEVAEGIILRALRAARIPLTTREIGDLFDGWEAQPFLVRMVAKGLIVKEVSLGPIVGRYGIPYWRLA